MANIVKKRTRNRGDQSKKMVLDAALPPLALQHVWFEMKKHSEWKSIALVPITDDIGTVGLAHGLGLMAVREPHDLVWVVNASRDPGDRIRPEDVSSDEGKGVLFPYKYVNLKELGINQEKQLVTAERMLDKLVDQDEVNGKVIFAVDSLLDQTHAISLCRSVDTVILCISLGHTMFNSVRRTIAIIGKEKIVGSIVVHPRRSNALKK